MTTTNLAAEDLAYIEDHIKSQLGEWLAEQSLGKPPVVYEIELRERMVRIEEELKNQRELIKTILEQMDKHFGAVEKRFESMQQSMDRRFEELTRRIDRFMAWSFATQRLRKPSRAIACSSKNTPKELERWVLRLLTKTWKICRSGSLESFSMDGSMRSRVPPHRMWWLDLCSEPVC